MRRNSVVVKLSLTIIFLSLFTIFPLGFTINKIFSGFYYNELETELEELVTDYSKLITTLEEPNILNMYETLGQLINKEIFIVNHEGIVVANSGFPGLMEGTMIYREDLKKLINGETIKKEYTERNTNEIYLSIGKPIFRDNQLVGGIFVAASINGIHESIMKVEKMIFLASIGSILLSMGIAVFLSRKLSNPLLQMEHATRKMAKGDLDSRVSISTKDEIGSLAYAINDLAIELKRYRTNRREFFANISHELRTPLTYIDGFTNALRKKLYKSDDEKEQMLRLVEQEAKRMTKLVDDLFELAKMEDEKLLLHFENVDIGDVIQSAVSKTKLKANEKGLEIKVELPKIELPHLFGDGLRLEQICLNLLENAIRYTEKGYILIRAWQQNNDIYLTIEDTGIGIPEKDIPYLFERFYRVDKSRSRKLGGTGLGLAIVYQLVHLHNGTIKVTSKLGEGTRFELKFPITKRGWKI